MVETNVKVYIACSSVLYLKFLLVTFIQGPKSFKSGSRPPEDAQLPMAEGREMDYGLVETKDKAVAKAREEVHRWQRIIANDLESIPFALFVFGGGILADSNDAVHASALIVYVRERDPAPPIELLVRRRCCDAGRRGQRHRGHRVS